MDHDNYSADYIRDILRSVKTVALVGASSNEVRPSYFVLKYLLDKGYAVTPVNPGLAGQEILGRRVYGALKDIPHPIDMVDIFRNSQAAGVITDEALALSPLPKVIWMQLSVRNDEAARRAEAQGLKVVMNRCPKMEYGKLSGEWGWVGGNSGVISSRRQRLHESGKVQSLGLGLGIKR
ncbi:MAG TPA: CoA-binding protein [Nordella sp.]|nr:CoA-binding protein [Nordella sp.]